MRKILLTSHQNTKKNQKNHWLQHLAQSRHLSIQKDVESQQTSSPLFDGSASWFKYEELIEDWLDLTVLERTKRGPALKNRLVGDAEMHKGLLKRESLRAPDGVKYFRKGRNSSSIRIVQLLKHLKKKDIAIPGNLMTGHPVSGLMILGLQLQDGMAREIILLGWRCPL